MGKRRPIFTEEREWTYEGNLTRTFEFRIFQGKRQMKARVGPSSLFVAVPAFRIRIHETWKRGNAEVYRDMWDTGYIAARAQEVTHLLKSLQRQQDLAAMKNIARNLTPTFHKTLQRDANRILSKRFHHEKRLQETYSKEKKTPYLNIQLPWEQE